jgi:hypothetical protein
MMKPSIRALEAKTQARPNQHKQPVVTDAATNKTSEPKSVVVRRRVTPRPPPPPSTAPLTPHAILKRKIDSQPDGGVPHEDSSKKLKDEKTITSLPEDRNDTVAPTSTHAYQVEVTKKATSAEQSVFYSTIALAPTTTDDGWIRHQLILNAIVVAGSHRKCASSDMWDETIECGPLTLLLSMHRHPLNACAMVQARVVNHDDQTLSALLKWSLQVYAQPTEARHAGPAFENITHVDRSYNLITPQAAEFEWPVHSQALHLAATITIDIASPALVQACVSMHPHIESVARRAWSRLSVVDHWQAVLTDARWLSQNEHTSRSAQARKEKRQADRGAWLVLDQHIRNMLSAEQDGDAAAADDDTETEHVVLTADVATPPLASPSGWSAGSTPTVYMDDSCGDAVLPLSPAVPESLEQPWRAQDCLI